MKYEYGALVGRCRQGNPEEFGGGKKPILMQHCPPQIPCGLTWEQTQASAVRGQ